MDKINIIPRYGGIIIHDCWASYFSYHQSEDELYGSHLHRELEFIGAAQVSNRTTTRGQRT